nr:alanine racemase [Enterovibrio nigricans]
MKKGITMFLEALKKQNSELIQSAVLLLRQGEILPDTYVIDVDRFRENAKKIKQKADELDIKLFAMTKQIGRNPVLASILIDECGYEGAVCVDFKEALSLHKNRIKISHVGHLVQPPKHILTRLISEVKPEIITVYSIEKAREISQVAVECGVVQGIMLKFYQDGDHLYPNQESGFHLSALDEVVERITALPNLNVTGITHFPCFLYDQDAQKTRPTANLTTAKQAIERLAQKGISITHRNYPSATSCETIAMIRQHGVRTESQDMRSQVRHLPMLMPANLNPSRWFMSPKFLMCIKGKPIALVGVITAAVMLKVHLSLTVRRVQAISCPFARTTQPVSITTFN